ncbi:MAG: hypothetical protein IPH39_13815 [Sulfuritalea sp.]|nr:hypothetical protein [Sulfuritalea sp.]
MSGMAGIALPVAAIDADQFDPLRLLHGCHHAGNGIVRRHHALILLVMDEERRLGDLLQPGQRHRMCRRYGLARRRRGQHDAVRPALAEHGGGRRGGKRAVAGAHGPYRQLFALAQEGDHGGGILRMFAGMAKVIQRAPVGRHIDDGHADAVVVEAARAARKKVFVADGAIGEDSDGPGPALKQHRAGDGIRRPGIDEAQRDLGTRRQFMDLRLGHSQTGQPCRDQDADLHAFLPGFADGGHAVRRQLIAVPRP